MFNIKQKLTYSKTVPILSCKQTSQFMTKDDIDFRTFTVTDKILTIFQCKKRS